MPRSPHCGRERRPTASFDRVQRHAGRRFLFALEHIGGFGGVADRLNAYNVFRGDPALITTDVERFEQRHRRRDPGRGGAALSRRSSANRALGQSAGAKRVHVPPLDRKVAPASAVAPEFRPPLPQIMELRGGIPLWVFLDGDLPTVTGSIVIPGGAGVQQPGQAGLAHLTVAMLEEGTSSSLGRADRAGRRVDGGNDQHHLRLGRCLRLVQMLDGRLRGES